jgi:hypothetical protein
MCPAPTPPEGQGANTPQRASPGFESGFSAGPRRRRTGLIVAIVVIALVAAGVGAFALLRSGSTTSSSPSPGQGPTSTTTPARGVFAFEVNRLRPVSLSKRGVKQLAAQAAGSIARQLSTFYDRAFADPASWQKGVPDDVWNIFDSGLRARAKSDATSFTPGTTGVSLAKLDVTKSTLTVTVLFDPSGHAEAAFADVVFQGTGELKDGGAVDVNNAATFYLRPISGTWVVMGYPRAKTSIDAGAASPSSSPGAGGSSSPSAGSSP